MKKRKLISIMLLVALLGTMFNFTVSAEESSADGTRVIYEENFDNCDWFNNGTISEAASGKFVKKPFFDYLNDTNLPITYTLENVQSKGADDTDKSLHINAEFKLPFGKKADGATADDWSGDAGSVGGGGVGNNGMSHRMIVSDNNQKQLGDDEKYVHISFSAAQDPMPKLDIANGQGAGLEVTLDFATKKQDGSEGQGANLRLLEWTNENRRQRVFDSYYEVGVPDQAPMSANKWIKYDYVFYTDSDKRTLDIYLNGYPVIKGLNITNKVNSGGKPAQITGLKNLNFQVRDMNTGTETRDVNVYIDDVKVTYGTQAPVVSTYSVFGEAAKIDAPEQYVDRETGIVYNYGQSLNDMKKYFPDKNVYMVAKKTGSSQYPAYFDNFWTTSTSTSLESGVMSGDGSIANPALCVENGNFFYCYEVRQPQATNIIPAIAAAGNSITLSWEGNAADCQGIEIFRDGEKIAALEGNVQSYTDTNVAENTAYEYTIRELLPDKNVSVFTDPLLPDGTKIIYDENFNERNWWEGENSEPSENEFKKNTFYDYLDNSENMGYSHSLESGARGREASDKSLHLNATFKLPFGQNDSGGNAPGSTRDGVWVGLYSSGNAGNNGVSHRMMTNSTAMGDSERYLHVSFSALQNLLASAEDGKDSNGAGLEVMVDFLTDGDNVNNERLLYYGGNQYLFCMEKAHYKMQMADKWINYDYVFDTQNMTVDIYVNGHPAGKGKDISGRFSNGRKIKGIGRLDFQVRDMKTGTEPRDVHVYVDDIKVTYGANAPAISTYSAFGEAAKIDAPEQYVDAETGIVYNYGQSLNDMKQYINGTGGSKEVYLAIETQTSGEWAVYERTESLGSRTLNDGRTVNPILCVTDENFFYSYEVRQPQATNITPAIAAAGNSITLNWEGNAADCQGIEIFRDGEKIAALERNAQSYTDTNVAANTAYEYTIRELLPDKNVSAFTDPLCNISKPESFAAAQVPNRLAVKLTWEAPKVGTPTGYEIYRNNELLTTVDADVFEYTDSSALKKDTTYRYAIAAIFGEMKSGKTPEASVMMSLGNVDSRVIYVENFNNRNWWNGETPTTEQFDRRPFFSYLDENNGQNMESAYELKEGANGRASDDKSLHLNATFKLPFGKQADGTTNIPNSAEEGTWMGGWDGDQGTNGVSHRMISNSQKMEDNERYLHVSFSAAQDPMPPESVLGENGAGLDVSFDFLTAGGNSEKEMLHWYGRRQGVFGTFYEVRTDAGKWANYDYVFDKMDKTMTIYVNGYPVVKEKDISNENLTIAGLSRLNFQVRDVNTGADERSIDVYVDDVKVAYSVDEPVVSPYFSFGDAAYIDAPEKYINNEMGIIYNYGQSLSDMKQYISGKNAYLVKEKADSTATWQSLENYSSNSLASVILNDGRVVSPILYVEDGNFTYCYEIKQPSATSIKLEVSDIAQDSITLGWSGKTENCRSIEIFRDGERIAVLEESAQNYADTDVVLGQTYEYTIREILEDGSATVFSEPVQSFISSVGRPENFAAAPVLGQLAIKLTWEAPRYGTVTGYEIYRNGVLLTTVGADAYEYTDDSTLTVGTAYRYSVAAVGTGSAKSDKTPEISIVADVIAPPENVKAEDADGNVKISWDSVEGAKGYEIYRNGVRAAQTSDCFYVLEDCADDSFYEFYVKTVNEADQLSRASETVRYIKHGSKFSVFHDIFGDALGDGLKFATTNGAVIESGTEYGAIGTSGVRIGFNSQNFAGQTAGFAATGGLDFSRIKSGAAEIRFLMYVPEGLDISKLSFGAVQNYNSSLAGKTVRLTAAVALDRYVQNTGWNLVRIPVKDLPQKGVYTATAANLPYEIDFNYANVGELVLVSELEGLAENTYFMVDEIAVYANQAPEVVSVKANGNVLENNAVISGQTNQFLVKFDTEMDEKQLSSNEMKIVCMNKKVPSIVEHDKNTDEYVISLLENLEPDKTYSVVVENAVSKGGTIQKQKYTLSFTTDSTAGTETVVKTVGMNLQSMSGTTSTPMVQTLDFIGGAANEAVCGFDIEISYDSSKLFLNKDEVKLVSSLKNSGITAENETGKLKIHCAADKAKTMSLKDGIGTFAIRALESGSSQISAVGKLYCYYPDADVMKEFAVSGSATISATAGSGGSSGSGGSGGGSGSSSIGGARPSTGGESSNPIITPPVKTTFRDISTVEWAREGILYLSENNIINGYEDNTFRPDNSITREEFVAIIVRAFAIEDENAGSRFSDVDSSAWYYQYVSSAVNAGIIKGVADNTFGTGETISRQDMCTIMSRIIESQNLSIDKKYSKLEFSDGSGIADYAKEAVSELQQMGIVNGVGDNMFAPEGEVTRAMAAKVVYQMIQGRNR